jgi:hypothetical protein
MKTLFLYPVLATAALLAYLSDGQTMPMDMGSQPGTALTGCFVNPTEPSCLTFTQPDADTIADLNDLCVSPGVSMPYMVVCSLWTECQVKGIDPCW